MNQPTSQIPLTRQREVVFRVVRESREHLTANEVFDEAKRLLPGISFATVYNSLRFLKDAGMITEINFGNGASRFDKTITRHDHAICVNCGKLDDLELEIPSELVQQAEISSNFQLESVQLTLRGLCPECQKSQ